MQIVFDTVHDTEDHIKHGIALLCSMYNLPPHTPVVLPAPVPVPAAGGTMSPVRIHVDPTSAEAIAAVLTSGIDQDARDPSAVFGAANAGNGAPLPAGAIPLPTAQTALPGLPLPPANAGLPPALPTTSTASASTASAPPAGTPGPALVHGVEIDKDGIPWDARIHANAAVKMGANGFWKKARGLNDEAMVNRVKAELRQAMAAGGIVAPAAAVPVPPAPVTLLPTPPIGTITPAAVPGAGPTNFGELMPKIGAAVNGGVLTMANVNEAVQAHGLPNIPAIGARPDMVPIIWAYLVAMFPALATV